MGEHQRLSMSVFQAVRAMRPMGVMRQQMLRSASSLTKTLGNTDVSVQALEVLSENSFDSILMTDAEQGNITYANKAFTLLTGHAATDVIGESPKILQGEGTDVKVISSFVNSEC